MSTRAKLALGAALVALAGAAALRLGAARGGQAFDELVARLASAPAPAAGVVRFAELEQLPAPVRRYFRRVLRDGQPLIRQARLEQEGVLRTGVAEERWLDFSAVQIVVPAAPGFAWNAKVAIAPLLHLRVLDAYVAGVGSGAVRLLSALTVAEESAHQAMNSGALHRYLAEAVWVPTALLPQAGVQWTPLDEHRAIATLHDHGTAVSLEFRFNDAGEAIGIYTPARWGQFERGYRQAPWEGHFRNYVEHDGMRVPGEGEVGWYDAGQWQVVWRGTITASTYEFEE